MRVLFIGVAHSPDEIRRSVARYYRGVWQIRPQQVFDYTLVKALSTQVSVTALSLPAVEVFPRSRCIFYPGRFERVSATLSIRYLCLANFLLLKSLMIGASVFTRTVLFGLANRRRPSIVVLGYISSIMCVPARAAAKLTGLKVTAIVPDVPAFMWTTSRQVGYLRRVLGWCLQRVDTLMQGTFDGYVLLSGAMNEIVNPRRKPSIVVEGMYEEDERFEEAPKCDKKTVMYAGGLQRNYGITTLVRAFSLCAGSELELWIYGSGELVPEILEAARYDERVRYCGLASKDEILLAERNATLLANVRPTAEEYTRYSFPSKTLEYMASGTPLLTTKLPGIPEDYYPYVFLIDDESPEGVARRMQEVLSLPPEELRLRGALARRFVLQRKNPTVQTARIVSLLRDVLENGPLPKAAASRPTAD